MQPKVSIIVPCWGVEKYLDRTMESLVNQTLKDIEIILVDDESPDRVPEMCDEWKHKAESREFKDFSGAIKVVHKKNGGLGFARNTGLEYATGEYVTFCDSDDWVEPDTYYSVYKKCKEKDLDICWFQPCRVKSDGTKIYSSKVDEEYFLTKEDIDFFRKDVIGRNVVDIRSKNRGMSSCMALFKRSTVESTDIRYPSERVVASEDFVFLMMYIQHVERVGILPNVFYNYFINPCSITTTYSEAKHTRLLNMLEVLNKFCLENYEWDVIKNHYFSQVLRIFKVIIKYTSYSSIPFKEKLHKISDETRNPLLTKLYNDPVRNKYSRSDRLFIWMMKHHIGIFFILLYKLKKS